jgi:hypothetical protein
MGEVLGSMMRASARSRNTLSPLATDSKSQHSIGGAQPGPQMGHLRGGDRQRLSTRRPCHTQYGLTGASRSAAAAFRAANSTSSWAEPR